MKIEQINATQYANIYGIYTDAGKVAGTVEVVIAGREAGKTFFYSWTNQFTRNDIKKAWRKRNVISSPTSL